jgi:hypothetical protein
MRKASGAEILTLHRHRKRQSATGAARPFQKGYAAPAGGAQARLGNSSAARHAERREQQIGQAPRDVFPIPRHTR